MLRKNSTAYYLQYLARNVMCALCSEVWNVLGNKLDGVGPVDNRPSTNYRVPFLTGALLKITRFLSPPKNL